MRALLTRAMMLSSALLMAAAVSAQAQGLERVGPTSPANGFPTWYQDKTGLTLEFCQPLVQAELDGGWCLLLPADTTLPETLPAPFSEEHFYWAANAAITSPALNATLVLALEGAFANAAVINGDQIVFARIRFRFDAPQTGTYTVYHPFGTDVVQATAGQRVFFTEDVGLTCPLGTFDCALRGRLGPFLLASNTPGGPELPGVPGPAAGKLYIADPGRLGPVTGSPVGQNYFRITGPGAIDVRSDNFTLMGRAFQGNLGGRVTVDRASYSRDAGSINGKVDVFATAFATSQPRLPGAPLVGTTTPALGFYPAACSVGTGGVLGAPAGVAAIQMFNADTRYYGQTVGAIPPAVCVQDFTARNANNQIVPSFTQKSITDVVTISQAVYNPAAGGILTVAANSSDASAPPQLTVAGFGSFTSGASLAANVGVPPATISVTSANGGRADIAVSTLEGQPSFPAVPIAGNDTFTVIEDSGANALNVLANDTNAGVLISAAQATIAVAQQPLLGTAQPGANGTIVFTPAPNKFGTDLLMYTVTVNGVTSSPAFVTLSITNVNDPPVAVDDAATGVGGLAISVDLLANDSDPDGTADLVGVVIASAPAGVTYTLTGGNLSFTALAGTYTFTYRAKDAFGATSNLATATVTLAGGETLGITRADYIVNKRRWRVDGTSSVTGTQTIFISYANGTFADGTSAAGTLVGTTQVVGGLFTLDLTLAGTNDPRNPTSALFSVRPTAIRATSSLGGSSPVTSLTLR